MRTVDLGMPVIPNPLNLPDEGDFLQAVGFEIVLERRRVGDLHLPTGRLVTCDPLESPETEPFAVSVTKGVFPVYAIIAKMRDTTRTAYVAVEFSENRPQRWEIAQLEGDESSWTGERHGAPVESNIIGLMDDSTAGGLLNYLEHEEAGEFERILLRSMRRNRRAGAEAEFVDHLIDPDGNANLLAFDVDNGIYVTYLGFDGDNEVALAVLDFEVLDYQFTPFGLKY